MRTTVTLDRAGRIVLPSEARGQLNQLQNINLRTTRDLLLPKLISGELDVSALPDSEALAA